MAPRVALFVRGADDAPTLPQTIGGADFWEEWHPSRVGDYPAREYRHRSGNCLVLVRVAAVQLTDTRNGALVVVWLPAMGRTGPVPQKLVDVFQSLAASNHLVKQWACTLDADGAFTVPALDADATAIGTRAKSVWPSTWRKRLPGDSNGDPFAVPPVPAAAPTGPRCLGVVLA